MEDKSNITVTGVYVGINSAHGIGKNHARIFVRKNNGSMVDGLVPLNVFNGLVLGNQYTLNLTKANDPALQKRAYIPPPLPGT